MSEKGKKQRSRRDRKEEGEGGQEDSWRWRKNYQLLPLRATTEPTGCFLALWFMAC